MSNEEHTAEASHEESYRKVRDAFEDLKAEDKAAFLVEATFSAVGTVFELAGKQVSDALFRLSDEAEKWGKKAAEKARSEETSETEGSKPGKEKPASPGSTV